VSHAPNADCSASGSDTTTTDAGGAALSAAGGVLGAPFTRRSLVSQVARSGELDAASARPGLGRVSFWISDGLVMFDGGASANPRHGWPAA
jgi:hypothetical protein